MVEIVWKGKYDDGGRKVPPIKVQLPLQTIETVNESTQERQKRLERFISGREVSEWRNRLIWGDKKYVLPSLLPEFAGKANLIYIDPPFDTGADFTFIASIPEDPDASEEESLSFTKEPSIIEQKAYRDTWGKGLDTWLQWFYETVLLLYELLDDNGFVLVHLDGKKAHYAKVIMDEIFNEANFRNEIIVPRPFTKNLQQQFSQTRTLNVRHDTLLFYSKKPDPSFPLIWVDKEKIMHPEGHWHHFWSNADRPTMRYELFGITPKSGQWIWEEKKANEAVENYQRYLREANGRSLVTYWLDTEKKYRFIRKDDEGKPQSWRPPADQQLADTLWLNVMSYENQKIYPTQKHEQLLERIIKSFSQPGDLVLDCFCGSGTTPAVAEKLGRRWVAGDLGRFAIHTTRKRLLSVEGITPFVIQNLGKYERQAWQTAEFGNDTAQRTRSYIDFILKLYSAQPLNGHVWLHGKKGNRLLHVGSVDSPISPLDVGQIVAEFKRTIGGGKEAPKTNGVDVLGWDFAFELNELAKQQAAQVNVDVRFLRIPREVLDKKAVEQGDIHFFELASLDVGLKKKEMKATVTIRDFVIPQDDVPADVQKEITHWSQWIDYWAVDWDNKNDTFHNEVQEYRTRENPKLTTELSKEYTEHGDYRILVKVIDILGNDTTKMLSLKV